MLKQVIRKIVERLYPELAAGVHLPILAVVTGVPDPPSGGEMCSEETPKYAVDIRLLKSDFTIDEAMPLMRDVPVALSGAAPDRGFALLPQPGTIVELAFAFGMQSHPYIRAVLPHGLKLPKIDELSMRWQQSGVSFQQVDAGGNWNRETSVNISDKAGENITHEAGVNIEETAGADIVRTAQQNITETALMKFARTVGLTSRETSGVEHTIIAPKLWVGSPSDNFLQIVADFMGATIAAFGELAAHTHTGNQGSPTSAPDCAKKIKEIGVEKNGAVKGRLEVIKK